MDNTERRTILSLAILLFCVAENYADDCSLRVNRDLSDNPPLILPSNGGQEFIFPKLSDGTRLRLPHYGNYRLLCPGTTFSIDGMTETFDDTLAYCNLEDQFFIADSNLHDVSFKKVSCQRQPSFTARQTVNNPCSKGTSYEVGYSYSRNGVQSEFFRVYDLCVDNTEANAVYSHATVLAVISEGQVSAFQQSFIFAGIYSGIPLNAIYTKNEQLKRLTTLLGDANLAKNYIRDKGEYYFAKGHLISNSDMFYIPHQRSTFVYANAVPMWQIVNNGNWKVTEDMVRGYVTVRQTDLETWVGGYGVLQLDDINGVKTDIYLHVDANGKKYVPVPKVLFKVVYNPTTRAGAVFLTANNPFLTTLPNDYAICTDVKSRITYRDWSKEKVEKGISYCCEIDDFRRVYNNLPQFVTSGLLV